MAGTGVVKSVTFTPNAAGRLVVSCNYDVKISTGSDWGVGVQSRCFVTQNGSTQLGTARPASSASRLTQTVQHVFDVVANQSVECGLYCSLSGAVSCDWWNVNVVAELRKR